MIHGNPWLRRCLRQTEGYLSPLFPAGMIRGGPDRAKVSQTYTLKRIGYSREYAGLFTGMSRPLGYKVIALLE